MECITSLFLTAVSVIAVLTSQDAGGNIGFVSSTYCVNPRLGVPPFIVLSLGMLIHIHIKTIIVKICKFGLQSRLGR